MNSTIPSDQTRISLSVGTHIQTYRILLDGQNDINKRQGLLRLPQSSF